MKIGFACAALAFAPLAAAPALAQGVPSLFNSSKGGAAAAPAKPPPALPGAASTKDAAPPQRLATDMEPTEALFDAINRGDIGAARDAISRGADLKGHNILGMSPLELSVDLGRNDISFMLLSMRGATGLSAQQQQPSMSAGKPTPAKAARQVPVRQPATRVAAPAPAQSARLFSGDGGTPNPNAGFLGFDSGRR